MLTQAQKKLIEDNHSLIYSFCIKHNLDIDEYYGPLAVRMCVAIKRFNPDIANISTFMFNVFTKELININTKLSKGKYKFNNECESLEKPIQGTEESLTLQDTVEGITGEDILQQIELNTILQYIQDNIHLKHYQVLTDLVLGLTQQELAKKYNTSQCQISRLINKARIELKVRFK